MNERALQDARPERLLTFKSGGWVLLLTAALGVLILVMTVAPALERARNRPPGDGRDPATYGFSLTPCLVPAEAFAAGQLHRDVLPSLVGPVVMTADDVEMLNREQRGKYLVPADRVIGVAVGAETRAYPLRIVQLHEIVNDTLGGRRITVTYNPLCDSAVVYDATPVDATGARGVPVEFGVSGLLFNSNLLMYGREAEFGGESLWSQLQGRAVTGPAADRGERLDRIASVLTHWDAWRDGHPDTTVITPDENRLRQYKETSYAPYFRSDELLFPVTRTVPEDGPWMKTRCVVVDAGGERRLYPFPLIASQADETGHWQDELGGITLSFRYDEDPEVVEVVAGDEPATVAYGLYFGWYALEPGLEVASAR